MASNLYKHQSKNVAKTWFLMLIFLIVVIAVGWAISWYYQSPGILIFAVVFAVVMNVTSYWYSDKIVVAITGAKRVERGEHRELWDLLENLSITAGLPMPKLYIVNDSVPNAFATGRDKEHAVVAVTTGLMQILEKNEMEGVLAHELSHIGNRDMLVSTVAVVLVGLVALLSDMFLRMTLWGGGNRDRGDGKAGMIILIIGLALAILSPIIASLIHMAISRKREFLADASGALLTRYPEGLANALRKISQHGGKMKRANNATAHLFIANPFGSGKDAKKFLHRIFMTHPPVQDRVDALIGKRASVDIDISK